MSFHITSPAFTDGEPIPVRYSGFDKNVSPPLRWSDPPPGTKSFVLLMDDPDAPKGAWVHWVLYHIPAYERSMHEGLPAKPILSDGSRQGKNSSQRIGYSGPHPPEGRHHYYFKLYALNTMPDLAAGATKEQVWRAIKGHVLAETKLMGTYSQEKMH